MHRVGVGVGVGVRVRLRLRLRGRSRLRLRAGVRMRAGYLPDAYIYIYLPDAARGALEIRHLVPEEQRRCHLGGGGVHVKVEV